MPGNSIVLYAASSDIFKSIDGGNTWSLMTGEQFGLNFSDLLPFEPFRINLATTLADPDRLFAYIWGIENGSSKCYIYYFDEG